MNPFARLFGGSAPPEPQHSQLHVPSQMHPASQSATRRELLRVVLRDTLSKHGIPMAWIGADVLTAVGKDREPGIHLRIVIKHWDPRLLECGVAFQKNVIKRAELFDPNVSTWLVGISWQFALADDSRCPPMPDPVSWTAAAARPQAVAAPDAKAALRRMFADAAPQDGDAPPNFEHTQPMFRGTEPARL
jgi:hypothetical protein